MDDVLEFDMYVVILKIRFETLGFISYSPFNFS